MPTIALRNQKESTSLSIKTRVKIGNIHKTFKNILHYRGSHKKAFKLMQVNMSSNIIIGGILPSKPTHPFPKSGKEKLD